jgi:hypothetical protein
MGIRNITATLWDSYEGSERIITPDLLCKHLEIVRVAPVFKLNTDLVQRVFFLLLQENIRR